MTHPRSRTFVRSAACALTVVLWSAASGCEDPASPLDDVSLVADYQGEAGSGPVTVTLSDDEDVVRTRRSNALTLGN